MKYLKIVMHIIFLINNILECWKYLVNIKVATTMKCIMIPCVFSHDSSLLWVTDDIYNIYLTLPFAVHPLGTLRCSARKQSCNTKPFCSYSASIYVSVTLFTFVLPFFSSLHNTRHTRNCARQFNIGQEREAGRLVT